MSKSYTERVKEDAPDDEAAFDEQPFRIYASPTVDTLEEGPYYRQGAPGPDISATAQPETRVRLSDTVGTRRAREATPTRSGASSLSKPVHQRASSAPVQRSSPATVPTVQYTPSESPSAQPKSRGKPFPPRPPARSPGKNKRESRTHHRDFQHPEDVMTVSARSIDLTTRTAFEPIPPVSVKEWHSIAAQVGKARKANMQKKLSPSLQHLELLHKMNSITSIRQLAFSPSVGLESDVFIPWDEDLNENGNVRRSRRRSRTKRDGRYRSIDPFKAVADALPSDPPVLSNRKYRLPMRSDVGFPNASEQEIIKKQQEIARETEWEEASPRLVVLVTSDDIGTAIHDDPPSAILLQHEEWNGGGLQGMPLAGKELMLTKERNVRLSKRPNKGQVEDRHEWKPDRTNMLAPPLEASYSSTYGWRPRPFNDLPPGMLHCLACPLNVSFDIGDIEPMVGSLALYCLPNDPSRKGAFGKMSEEYYFPVGSWKGHVSLEAAKTLQGALDTDMIEAWHGRKHKGLFPYDPLAVPWDHASLYLVMQIYKVPHSNASAPYIDPNAQRARSANSLRKSSKSLSKRFKGSVGKLGKTGEEEFTDDMDIGIAQSRSSATFDTFRTQFLTPLCFGITPLFPQTVVESVAANGDPCALESASMSWPNGATNKVELYAFPSSSLSQDEFVKCLATISAEETGRLTRSHLSNDGRHRPAGDLSFISDGTSVEGGFDVMSAESSISGTPSKGDGTKKSLRRRSSAKATSSSKRLVDDRPWHLEKVAGSASLFISSVGNDFTQSMLYTPIELLDSEARSHSLPRLLVDVSGDCAIMMNPSSTKVSAVSAVQGFEAGRRRSDLVRLPLSSSPSGYAGASEVRQVLYLPPRSEKQYDLDPPSSFRSCLNLLYMYPRLLRVAQDANTKDLRGHGKQSKKELTAYSVRIQLVRNPLGLEKDTESQVMMESFHNPAPWAGPQMLEAVFTKINEASKGKSADHELYGAGIAFRDEIKMRLPMILDGTYFLRFTLFIVKFNDDCDGDDILRPGSGVTVDSLAQTTIPLSSTSNREPRSGIRVATVIPNGSHRIRLGDYLLQLETRLVSSVHVCDPTLAAVLRDFPYAKDRSDASIEDNFKELALVPSGSIVGKSLSGDPGYDKSVPFHQMFASSAENTILGYFPVLVYIHLCNLVNFSTSSLSLSQLMTEEISSENKSGYDLRLKFAMDNMNSLLEIFRKVKIKLGTRTSSRESRKRADLFVKSFLDNFDEASLLRDHESTNGGAREFDLDAASSERSHSSATMAGSKRTKAPQYYNDDDVDTDGSEDEDNVSIVEVRRRNDKGQLKSSLTFDASGAPFSRVAFGASKTDRMRVEAELFHQSNQFTQLFDDDETVVTSLHSLATPREEANGDGQNGMDPLRGYIVPTESDEDSIVSHGRGRQTEDRSSGAGTAHAQGLNESAFAKRVRTAAQVIIAPCITPSLAAVLTGGSNSPQGASSNEQRKQRTKPALKSRAEPTVETMKPSAESAEMDNVYMYPGSDADEDFGDADSGQDTDEPVLRSCDDVQDLAFTISDSGVTNTNEPDIFPFVYEMTMVLWLRSFVAQIEMCGGDDEDSISDGPPSIRHSALFRALSEDANVSASAPFYMFHSHMDILLPLCLKSFLLRCTSVLPDSVQSGRILLDECHMKVFVLFIEMLAHGLIGEAMEGPDDDAEADLALLKSLSTSQFVLDFIVGLASVLHPQHVAVLLQRHFKILRDFEIPDETSSGAFVWSKNAIRRARCSRQLRLRSVERLACLPNFVALNYPLKYRDKPRSSSQQSVSWFAQSTAEEMDGLDSSICPYLDGRGRIPESGWLANLLAGESLSIASLSCEAVVAEAIAHVETSSPGKSPRKGPNSSPSSQRAGASLKRDDLLMFQSLSIHAVTCVYELLLRRNAMDVRFQRDQARSRIAAMFAPIVLEKSLKSTRWLARMEATHKSRSTWLLCFIYIIQEAPEVQLRCMLQSYCSPPSFHVHRFIRLLRLSSATFQSFIEQPRHSSSESVLTEGIAPWLLQECFNTICATANMLVDECAKPISSYPREEMKMTQGILDLLLHVLTAPQSSVTYLRTVGGALHALNNLGVENFLEAGGVSIQHWLRVILTLMNSTSLSVRSMAVDFVVSLLGATFDAKGNVDEISTIIATVLPEVVAREIALYSVNGLIQSIEDVERSVWPLRRSLADVEEANPLDDDRVDPFLSPLLSTLCRACQAIIDGVLVELRLKGTECTIVGAKVHVQPGASYIFDADEESLYEAASFFVPETAPLQRLRWLFTLARLHEAKGQWVEAAETLVLCAKTASDAMPHVKNVWRPSRFVLWHDSRRSLWLSTVGQEIGHPDRGHEQVMQFADAFLEPPSLVNEVPSKSSSSKLPQPTIQGMCNILTYATKQAVSNYLKEVGMDELASSRLEELLQAVMLATDDHNNKSFGYVQKNTLAARKRSADEIAALRRVSAALNGELAKLAEQAIPEATSSRNSTKNDFRRRQHYVRVMLSGTKPNRFVESTTIPTFLEWNNPCICRVPRRVIESAVASAGARDSRRLEEQICKEFGGNLRSFLLTGPNEEGSLMFRTGAQVDDTAGGFESSTTFLDVSIIHMDLSSASGSRRDNVPASRQSRHFFYRKPSSSISEPPPSSRRTSGGKRPELLPESTANVMELTVAHHFPCALSRQRTLLTSEILANSSNEL